MASHRSRWEKAFRELAERALDYMEELDDDQAAELRCVRAVSILPDDTELHARIIDFMVDHGRQPELIRYLAHLSRRGSWIQPLTV